MPFTVRVPDVSRAAQQGEAVALTARERARARRAPCNGRAPSETVLGCDTVVDARRARIYGKPADEGEARADAEALAARTHDVVSGLVLLDGEERAHGPRPHRGQLPRARRDVCCDWYVSIGEWRGRAGGYAIQGAGSALVRAARRRLRERRRAAAGEPAGHLPRAARAAGARGCAPERSQQIAANPGAIVIGAPQAFARLRPRVRPRYAPRRNAARTGDAA